MNQVTTIEIEKDYLHFSAAHFTIFSKTSRERLHGHNFSVSARVIAGVGENGMCFDYSLLKNELKKICQGLNEFTLIPAESPHLIIKRVDKQCIVEFNGQAMILPIDDVKLLPLRNITIEELSHLILGVLLSGDLVSDKNDVHSIEIKLSSGPKLWATSSWKKGDSRLPYDESSIQAALGRAS